MVLDICQSIEMNFLENEHAETSSAAVPPAKERHTDESKDDTSKADTSKDDTSKADTSKADTSKADTSKTDTSKVDSKKAAARGKSKNKTSANTNIKDGAVASTSGTNRVSPRQTPFDPLDVIIVCPFCKRVGGMNPRRCDFCDRELPFYAVQNVSNPSSVGKNTYAPPRNLRKENIWSVGRHELPPSATDKNSEPHEASTSKEPPPKRYQLTYKRKHRPEKASRKETKFAPQKPEAIKEQERGKVSIRKLFEFYGRSCNGVRTDCSNQTPDSLSVQKTLNLLEIDMDDTFTASNTLLSLFSMDNECIAELTAMQERISAFYNSDCDTDSSTDTSIANSVQVPKTNTIASLSELHDATSITNCTDMPKSPDSNSISPKQQNSVYTKEQERTDSPNVPPSNTCSETKSADLLNGKHYKSSAFTRGQSDEITVAEQKKTVNSSAVSLPDNAVANTQLLHAPNFDSSLTTFSPYTQGTVNIINNQNISTDTAVTSLLNGHKHEPLTVCGTSNNADCNSVLPIESPPENTDPENLTNSRENPSSSSGANHNLTNNISNGLKRKRKHKNKSNPMYKNHCSYED